MYKIDKGLAPQYLIDLIPRNLNTHNYNTRNFRNCRCNLVIKQNSFFPKMTTLYNGLPTSLKTSLTLASFKKQCKADLLLKQANDSVFTCS